MNSIEQTEKAVIWRHHCKHQTSDSGSGDPGSILVRVGVLFP